MLYSYLFLCTLFYVLLYSLNLYSFIYLKINQDDSNKYNDYHYFNYWQLSIYTNKKGAQQQK